MSDLKLIHALKYFLKIGGLSLHLWGKQMGRNNRTILFLVFLPFRTEHCLVFPLMKWLTLDPNGLQDF